jgi:hypothetical protein
MTDLSPAAQAVLTAFGKYPLHGDHIADTLMHGALPAALRAAADQLITVDWSVEMEELHDSFHAIANELEAQ